MSELAHSQPHSVAYYIKIWAVILVLFVVSVSVAVLSEDRPLVLVTAFGIAIVQAILVAAYFMHLNVEKRYSWVILVSMLLALAMFYFGVKSDVNRPSGQNWVATDSMRLIKEHEGQQPMEHGEHSAEQPAGSVE
jgi:caa(3)-type oxidase subunit IV